MYTVNIWDKVDKAAVSLLLVLLVSILSMALWGMAHGRSASSKDELVAGCILIAMAVTCGVWGITAIWRLRR